MDWLWQNLFSAAVWEILLIIGGATLLGWLRKKLPEHAPTIQYALVGAVCVAILLFVFTGHGILTKQQQPVTIENIEQNIRAWADDLGMSIARTNRPDTYFSFSITLPGGATEDVFRAKEKTGYLQFLSTLTIAPEHQAILSKFTLPEKQQFVSELTLEIERANLDETFGSISSQDPNAVPAGIFVQHGVPIQSLNEGNFGETFDTVARGIELVKAIVQVRVAQASTLRSQP